MAGDINIKNNIFFDLGKALSDSDYTIDSLEAMGNVLEDAMLSGISRDNDGGLIPQPKKAVLHLMISQHSHLKTNFSLKSPTMGHLEMKTGLMAGPIFQVPVFLVISKMLQLLNTMW